MGNIARYTDLSAELPTDRAYVDVPLGDEVPLGDAWLRIAWRRSWPDAGPLRGGADDAPAFRQDGDESDEV